MKAKISLLFSLLMLFLQACSTQPYLQQNSAFIVFKTPTMKYADQGFVYMNKEEIKAEIYGSGQALFSLKINKDSVCTGQFSCLSKRAFTNKVLSPYYPDDTIEQIFRAVAIFNGEKVYKKRNGFTQKLIKPNKYHIDYSVLNNETIFRDTINHITIKIKRMKG